MSQANRALEAKRLKLKVQTCEFAHVEAHKDLCRFIDGPKSTNSSELVAAWLASHKVTKCKPSKYVAPTKRGGTTLGAASPGRSTHVYGMRHVYSK